MFAPMNPDLRSRLLLAWLLTALTDGIFASSLNVFAYGSTVMRLWQGVAFTVLGPAALTGGMRTALVGVALHLGVALGWTLVFLVLLQASSRLRRMVATPAGIIGVAAAYGPAIWLVMSLAVIPLLTGRPTTITVRWWVQLLGHIPFVALPIVAMSARGRGGAPATVPAAVPG
jgi:hypothetical protein